MIEWLMVLGIALIVIGFILIGIEMIIPGFGAPGIAGIICMIVGLFLTADTIEEGIIILLIVLALLTVMLVIILRLLAKGKLKSPIILKDEISTESGFISSNDLKYLLGKKGTAATDLRPAGRGNFDGVEFNIISEGKYITKDTPIEICKVEGSKLIVKEI
ncbi:MAG: serine protease [Lachnospiraceae bacterium]|nr:serine protease [Lachnospiraceae bacterium]